MQYAQNFYYPFYYYYLIFFNCAVQFAKKMCKREQNQTDEIDNKETIHAN